jgi:hypothetical protein
MPSILFIGKREERPVVQVNIVGLIINVVHDADENAEDDDSYKNVCHNDDVLLLLIGQ